MSINHQPPSFTTFDSIPWQDMGSGIRRKILTYDEKIMMVRVDFEKGAVGALHQHPHIQVTHIESGYFEVEISGIKKILKAGDVFHVPSNALHGVVCLDAGALIDVFNPMREDFLV